MWCPHCKAEVAIELSGDNRRVQCTACGQTLGEPKAEVRGSALLDEATRSARQLLQRWSMESDLDLLAPRSRSRPSPNKVSPVEPASSSTSPVRYNKNHSNDTPNRDSPSENDLTEKREQPQVTHSLSHDAATGSTSGSSDASLGDVVANEGQSGNAASAPLPGPCGTPGEVAEPADEERPSSTPGSENRQLQQEKPLHQINSRSPSGETSEGVSLPDGSVRNGSGDIDSIHQNQAVPLNSPPTVRPSAPRSPSPQEAGVPVGLSSTKRDAVSCRVADSAESAQSNDDASTSRADTLTAVNCCKTPAHSAQDTAGGDFGEGTQAVERSSAAASNRNQRSISADPPHTHVGSSYGFGEAADRRDTDGDLGAKRFEPDVRAAHPAPRIRLDQPHGLPDASHVEASRFNSSSSDGDQRPSVLMWAGQLLAYLGVLGLTAGSCLVLWSYFGGPARYAPTGWLVTTASQMLLFLGVVTLVSGGLEQTTRALSRRIDRLADRIVGFEHAERQPMGRGPVTPPAAFWQQPDGNVSESAEKSNPPATTSAQ